MSNTFKSYIGFNDDSNQVCNINMSMLYFVIKIMIFFQFENNSGNDSLIETLTPRLLSG